MSVLEDFKALIERKNREIDELKKGNELLLKTLLSQGKQNTELKKKIKEICNQLNNKK